MDEILTEESIKLNEIAQDRYGKGYHELCSDRQAVVRRLQASGYPNI